MMKQPEPVTLFLSYAHKDESLCDQLKAHLSLLQQQGLVSTWHDRRILPGADWAQEIDTYLETAPIVLLLVSASFFASNYCIGVEMKRAMSRHEAGQARVIPILVRPCDWKSAPFVHLQILPKNAKAITAWNNRDKAWADVIAGIRRVIEELPLLSVSTSPAALPPIWNVPYPHNPFFTGREELLTQLATSLQTGQPTALSQPQAITGLGGIGKTQLALEYAYRYRQDYQAVLWALADTRENLTTAYLTLARLLELPEKDVSESTRIIEAIKRWLQTQTGYLLILDNADDLTLAHNFLPPSTGGHIVLTTRTQATGRLAHRLEVETLPQDLGALLLLRRAGLLAPDALLENTSKSDQAQARAICDELGGLPLALDQAGAYMEETGYGLADYRQVYQRHCLELLNKRGGLVEDHPAPVATTWSLSFQKVEEKNPAAGELLRLCAFLAPDAIPEEIIVEGASSLGPVLEPVATDTFLLGQAIEALRTYSLVTRHPEMKTLSVHRLVQAILQDSMMQESRQQWAKRALLAVNATFPEVEHASWPQCERLLPHALATVHLIELYSLTSPEAAHLLNQTGQYLAQHARYAEAEISYQHALHIHEQALGPEHPEVAYPLHHLANLYREQGKYAEVEPLYQRALHIREQALGPDHPLVAYPLNGLAILFYEQGKYAEAEPLYQRALHTREQALGPDHPLVTYPLTGLAALYNRQSKYAEAESLYQRAFHIREQALGPEHWEVAYPLHHLANLYRDQGKYAEAAPLYQRALCILEQALGLEHPYMAGLLNSLAILLYKQGKYVEAEPLHQRALHIWEQALGPKHPDIAYPLTGLANLYRAQGKYEQAEPLFQRALAIHEQQLGSNHPHTASGLNNLASLYLVQGQYEQAEPLFKRALSIDERALGPQHPTTQRIRANYARLLRTMGHDAEAAALDQP